MLLLALLVILLAFLFPALFLFRIVGLVEVLVGDGCIQLLTAKRSVFDFSLSEEEVLVFFRLGVRAGRGLFRRG